MDQDDQDVTVQCAGCGKTFVVTAGEQRFLRQQFGDSYQVPRWCRPCREIRKAKRGPAT